MDKIYIKNKYTGESDLVFIRHIASIYMEQDTVVVRLDNGHRIYTEYESVEDADRRISFIIGGGTVQ